MVVDKSKTVLSINITSMKAYLSVVLFIVVLASTVFGAISSLGRIQIKRTVEPILRKEIRTEVSRQLVGFQIKEDERLANIQSSLQTLTSQTTRNTAMLQMLLRDRLSSHESEKN